MRDLLRICSLICFLLLCLGGEQASSAAAKQEVVIYQYDGVAAGVTSEKFGMFRGILQRKLLQLGREIPAEFQHLEQLKKPYPKYYDRRSTMSPDGIQLWLKNQASVLCLLTGTIVSEDDENYLVLSNFYLGELKAHLPYDPLSIPLSIKLTEFSNIQDSHSLVIFYALAMEAKRLGLDKSLVAHFLAMAKNTLADIEGRSNTLYADLKLLQQAIEQAENDLLGVE